MDRNSIILVLEARKSKMEALGAFLRVEDSYLLATS